MYFSEHLFWARVRSDDSLSGWLATWAAYSLLAYLFLILLSFFRVKNRWALFLAAAAFGWLAEGVMVQTTYEMLPLSLSFTGLAWHALLSVWLGWYALRKILLAGNAWSVARLSSLIGIAYGFWAIFWWGEPDGGIATIPEFAAFTFITNFLAIIAYWLAGWSSCDVFTLNRWTIISISSLFLLYFAFIAIPAAPIAIVILPLLLGLVYWGLRRNRQREEPGSLLEILRGHGSLWNYLSLLALPLCAVGVYTVAITLHLQWRTGWVIYAITTPLGFILFGLSLYKLLKKQTNSTV